MPLSSSSGSALILTLLITALLATVAVSFLSTSRIEQIAAKNFTRQNAATGLAEMATQQAMAKIQQGFTVNGTGTTIITTQPGAIWQYTFSSGTCSAVTGKNPVELFSTNGTINANLNNLQNPGNSSALTSNNSNNAKTITGNASELILVPMENITSNGTVIGRVAYFVDDEGTKINLNSSTGDRTVLNAANPRPFSLDSLASFSWGNAFNSTRFTNIINGVGSSNNSSSDSKNWSYFYRPEQLFSLGVGLNASNTPAALFSKATSAANSTANMTHLLTPWGTQRIEINTLSTNATYPAGPGNSTGDASVRSIFEALTGLNGTTMNATSNSTYELTGRGLQNVFGGNFSTKYTPLGVKQIAANMLQMRDPNTFSINASGNYSGALLGANNYNATTGIPNEYLGYAPYPVISEIGFSGMLISQSGVITLNIQPMIEIYNPYPYPFTFPATATPRITFYIKKVSFTLNGTANGSSFSTNFSVNAPGDSAGPNANWGWSRFMNGNPENQTFRLLYDKLYEINGNSTTINSYKKIQTRPYNSRQGGVGQGVYLSPIPSKMGNFTVTSISNAQIEMHYVKITANSHASDLRNGYIDTIRDWVSGNEIGPMDITMKPMPAPLNMILNPNPLPNTDPNYIFSVYYADSNFGMPGTSPPPANSAAPVPITSSQRISHISKSLPSLTINDTARNWTTTNNSVSTNWLDNSTTWITSTSSNFGVLGSGNSSTLSSNYSVPSFSQNYTIPSDPSLGDSVANAVYAGSNASDMREPFLLTGNYTCPADLGFVPTNRRWRRLRMQMQPSAEGSMIPDWAMLDVISFGNSSDPNNAFNRMVLVNINGRFHLPAGVQNTSPPTPRTIGVKALAEVLSTGGNGSIQDPTNPANSVSTDATRFKGTSANSTAIADAIGNMTWSANSRWGNSTSNSTSFRRNALRFPADQYILPSEIMEIDGVADAEDQTKYNNSTSHFKWNEGRASALIPAVTTRSSFFTIYAYAQAGNEIAGTFVPDSEALTKTLVEVEITTPATATTPAQYKVKKLYTQPIPLGQ